MIEFQPQHLMMYLQKNEQRYQAWRHDLHTHPETAFEEYRTAAFVADRLTHFGLDVHTKIAKTGVVATLMLGEMSHRSQVQSQQDIPRIGLRADMDALPIHEESQLSYRSQYQDKMHACGHDGHVVMLLAAAEYLSTYKDIWKKNPAIEIVFIFQPAEENVAGGRVMIEEGLFERFPVDEVYALHNLPGLTSGSFHVREGAQMASADFFDVNLMGQGGHAAWPQCCDDLIIYASQCIQQWQTLISRRVSALESVVISVTQIHAGESLNALPAQLTFKGTVRCLNEEIRQMIEREMLTILQGICALGNLEYTWHYDARYPITWNTKQATQRTLKAAHQCLQMTSINDRSDPLMGAEDFGWMLKHKPGAYILLGAGDTPMLHHNQYDFNDNLITIGAEYWVHLCDIFIKDNNVNT